VATLDISDEHFFEKLEQMKSSIEPQHIVEDLELLNSSINDLAEGTPLDP